MLDCYIKPYYKKIDKMKYYWANRLTINVTVNGGRVVGVVVGCAQHAQGLCSFYILQILKNLFNETIILFLKQFQVNFM